MWFSFVPYILVILLSSMLAIVSQKYVANIQNNEIYNKMIFLKRRYIISFLIAWVFIAFTNVGIDYNNYLKIAKAVNWSNFASFPTLEIGFNLIIIILKSVFGNCDVVLFCIKTITLVIVYLSVYSLRNEIRVGYALAAYFLLFYIPSFYLLSICLAASVVFADMVFWYKKRNLIVALIILFIAANIHNSCYIFIPVFIASVIVEKNKSINSLMKASIVLLYVVLIAGASYIFNWSEQHLSFFHYGNYNVTNSSGSGLMVYVIYLPLVIIAYIMNKREENIHIRSELFVFVVSILLFRILSYRFVVIERMEFLFIPVYSFLLPKTIHSKVSLQIHGIRHIPKFTFFVICYMLFRSYFVFTEFIAPNTGLMNYVFYNPFM